MKSRNYLAAIIFLIFLALRPFASVFEQFREFRAKNLFTDLVLISQDGIKFPCHRLMVATYSSSITRMFAVGLFKEDLKIYLPLDLSGPALKFLLYLIYNQDQKSITYDPNTNSKENSLLSVFLELLRFAKNVDTQLEKKLESDLGSIATKKFDFLERDNEINNVINTKNKKLLEKIFNDTVIQPILLKTLPEPINISTAHFNKDNAAIMTHHDKEVKIWDLNGQITHTLKGLKRIASASFSLDSKCVLATSWDNKIKIWNAFNGKKILARSENSFNMIHAALNPDGTLIAITSDNKIKVRDIFNFKKLLNLEAHSNRINSVAFNKEGTLILTASNDQTAKVFNALDGTEIISLWHAGPVNSAVFSACDHRILTISQKNRTVKIWDAFNGSEIFTRSDENNLLSAKLGPNGHHIVIISRTKIAEIWNIIVGKKVLEFELDKKNSFRSVEFSSDGRCILAGPEIWILPPTELYDDEALFQSESSSDWLTLKYYLNRYLDVTKEQRTYEGFIDYARSERFLLAFEKLYKNEWLDKYIKALFSHSIQ